MIEIVSTERLYLFIHLPKCGGTTVIKSLCNIGASRFVIVSRSPNSKLQAWDDLQRHMAECQIEPNEVRAVMGHDVYFGMHQFSTRRPYYFTFLRHPVDRYISHYRYLVDATRNPKSRVHDFANQQLFENGKLLSLSDTADRRLFANVMTGYLAAANDPDLATKRWQDRDHRRSLELAKDLVQKLDFVGTVEKMPADLDFICNQVGIRPVTKKFNSAIARVDERVDQSLINRIEEVCYLDNELYHFASKLRALNSC